MTTHIISIGTILSLLVMAQSAAGQDEQKAPQAQPPQNVRQSGQNISPDERERLRNEMREKWQNMSAEEREKFRSQMRDRFGGGPARLGRQEQLEAIKVIEEQVAKIKAALEAFRPEDRSAPRDLSQEERAKIREQMMTAMRERQMAIRSIDEQLEKLRGPARPGLDPARIEELKQIHALAVKENATETAKRLESLMASYRGEFTGPPGPPMEPRPRGDVPRPQREPDRFGGTRPPGARDVERGRRAPEFSVQSFDGKTVSLSDLRGKIVVLEWFNFECPFVQYHYDKANTMINLAAKYKDKNVVWLAVNSTSHATPDANKEFAEKHKLNYPILDDRSGQVGKAYGAKTTPHLFVIDPAGHIVYDGAIDNSPLGKTADGQEPVNYVDNVLAALTTGKDIAVSSTASYGCSVKYPQ